MTYDDDFNYYFIDNRKSFSMTNRKDYISKNYIISQLNGECPWEDRVMITYDNLEFNRTQNQSDLETKTYTFLYFQNYWGVVYTSDGRYDPNKFDYVYTTKWIRNPFILKTDGFDLNKKNTVTVIDWSLLMESSETFLVEDPLVDGTKIFTVPTVASLIRLDSSMKKYINLEDNIVIEAKRRM